MKKIEEKILGYAHKLMIEQRDRYEAGLKNDLFSAEDAYDELVEFYEDKQKKREERYKQFIEELEKKGNNQ